MTGEQSDGRRRKASAGGGGGAARGYGAHGRRPADAGGRGCFRNAVTRSSSRLACRCTASDATGIGRPAGDTTPDPAASPPPAGLRHYPPYRMQHAVWVVIPTYNEAANVETIVRAAAAELDAVAPGDTAS